MNFHKCFQIQVNFLSGTLLCWQFLSNLTALSRCRRNESASAWRLGATDATLTSFRVLWFSCFLVSFHLGFFIVFYPNFGTYSSQSFTSPSSYTSLALNYSTSFYQPTAFHQSLISYATPPLLRLCQGNLFLCFHKFHCLKSIPRT